MRKAWPVFTVVALLLGLMASARADVVTAVTTSETIHPVPLETKIEVRDLQNFEGRVAMMERLRKNGFDVTAHARNAEYRVLIKKVGLMAMVDGEKVEINPGNQDKYKDVLISPNAASIASVVASTQTGDTGRKRGVFDVDGGVVRQGAALTGNTSGGLAVGAIGALIGMVVDGIAQNRKTDDLPDGVAVLIGRLVHVVGGAPKAVDVVIAAASDAETTSDALLAAVMDKYAELVAKGYKPRPSISEAEIAMERGNAQ